MPAPLLSQSSPSIGFDNEETDFSRTLPNQYNPMNNTKDEILHNLKTLQLTSAPENPTSALEKLNYSNLGRVSFFESRPSIVHFGGYTLNRVSTQVLNVTNVGPLPKRLLIVQPTTPYFKLRYEKAGVVAPGMAQKICIDFFPDECRYFYDCIRIRAEGDSAIDEGDSANNLLIPIHGYPVVNSVIFPTRIDFGDCFVSESVTRRFNIECKVPIQFEYELTLVRPNPNFKITPLSGVIPPNGKAVIEITFVPGMYGTFDCEILVNVSQFNFTPFKCRIIGSSSPGKHRQREMETAARNITMGGAGAIAPLAISSALGHTVGTQRHPMEQMTASMLETYDRGVPAAAPRGKGSGAARDAGAEWYTENMRKVELERREDPGPPPPLPESVVEGLRFPGEMRGTKSLNYVLTQTVGKLKPKDLKEAIRQQREFRAKQKQEQEEARARTAGGAGGRDRAISGKYR